MYDTDRSGYVDSREFAQALSYLRLNLTQADAFAIFSIIDSDGNGRVSQDEFIKYYVENF